jgi:hypothetical protein
MYDLFGSADAKAFDHCLGDLPATLKTLHIRESWAARHPLRNAPPGLRIQWLHDVPEPGNLDLDVVHHEDLSDALSYDILSDKG